MIKESQTSTNCSSPHIAQLEKLRQRESRRHVQVQTKVEGEAKEKHDFWYLSFLLVALGIFWQDRVAIYGFTFLDSSNNQIIS